MRLLPPSTSENRVVALSICVPGSSTDAPAASTIDVDRLVAMAGSSKLPVTWGVSPQDMETMYDRLGANREHHELALLGDATWLGSNGSRGTMVRVLNAAAEAGETIGQAPTSLLLSGVPLEADFDLLAKHGINIVGRDVPAAVNAKGSRGSSRGGSLRTLRFGVWEFPATIALPRASSRFSLLGGNMHRVIERAGERGELVHIAVDGPALLKNATELRALERLMERLATMRQQGRMQVQTLSSIASQLGHSSDRQSATSILRSPAA